MITSSQYPMRAPYVLHLMLSERDRDAELQGASNERSLSKKFHGVGRRKKYATHILKIGRETSLICTMYGAVLHWF
jgi:hypothetical protein